MKGNKSTVKRHTHATNACFEDSLAVLADAMIENQMQDEYIKLRLEKLINILRSDSKAKRQDILNELVDLEKSGTELNLYSEERLTKLMKILQTGRQGPNAYDPDLPAGKRKTKI